MPCAVLPMILVLRRISVFAKRAATATLFLLLYVRILTTTLGAWQARDFVGALDQPGGEQRVYIVLAAAIFAVFFLHDLGEQARLSDDDNT